MSRLILFEDEHLLVVNKPAGINTHAPSPFAGEGIYEWLKNREPRWASLAIIHRLDKETSGALVFGKTPLANRSLTAQFTDRAVSKIYWLVTDRDVPQGSFTVRSSLIRSGEKYISRAEHLPGERAETTFEEIKTAPPEVRLPKAKWRLVKALPMTGRTHQIRAQAAQSGFPILGDLLYGGSPAERVFLHARSIQVSHPATGQPVTFTAPVDFSSDTRFALRRTFVDAEATNSFRLVHGASDGWPGWYVDSLGDFYLSQSERPLSESQLGLLRQWQQRDGTIGIYHKQLSRHVRGKAPAETSAALVAGTAAEPEILIRENGVSFSLRFHEGYSTGLFLDQRDNRRRLLTGYAGPGFFISPQAELPLKGLSVLNAFAYTCAFSVCAARAGATVTSLDLSKKYLEWGRRNFELNELDPARHDFIFGDAFDWMRRLAKKDRAVDLILLDPPTFSQSKEHGVFRAEKDYGKLVAAALPLLKPGGVLFASTNAATLKPELFLEMVEAAIGAAGRGVLQRQYVPQPPDFPVSREEPAYLKTVWMRVS